MAAILTCMSQGYAGLIDHPSSTADVRLVSPLDRAGCVARLRAGLDSPWAIFGSRPLIGEVGYSHASMRRRMRWRGLFRCCLDVQLIEGDATTLVCKPGLHPLAAFFTIGWVGAGIAGLGLVGAVVVAGGWHERLWPLLALPLVLLSLLALLPARGSVEDDRAFLIEALSRMTDAVQS
jgi:hypothetical protein